jgi:peptidyl-prolyl cis-trans isomerase SurA
MLNNVLGRTGALALLLATTAGAQQAAQQSLPPGQPLSVDRVVAVVGGEAILWSDVMMEVNQRRAAGMPMPADSAGQIAVATEVLDDLVDVEILVQQAKRLGINLTDAEVTAQTEQQFRRVRAQFASEDEFRRELRNAGFGSPEEYRRSLSEQFRKQMLQQRAFEELRKRMRPADVSEEEITAAFTGWRERIGRRPATVSFRQIVVAPRASEDARNVARAKAESLLVEIRRGGDFEAIARRESMDPGSRELGGDLGWARRGSGFVPEFERVVFSLRPGQVSPVFETSFGYHIVRVDRAQPAEVKSRHILIRPVITESDIAAARDTAASVAGQWRAGTNFETLVSRYHDPAEERGILQPFPRDSLPESYQAAIAGAGPRQITEPFQLGAGTAVKFAVLEVVSREEGGEYTLSEVRERIRQQLAQERSTRQLLDDLRRTTFVDVRL